MAIRDEPVKESLAGFFVVVIIALPSVEGGVLEGAGKAKSDRPGEGAVFDDSGKICGGLLGSLATGKEDNTGEVGGDVVLEGFGSFDADFIGSGGVFILFASDDHVAFEYAGAEVDLVVGEFAEEDVENVAGYFGGLIDAVVAVVNDFGFDDGNEASGLALASISGEAVAVFGYGVVGGGEEMVICTEADFESGAPFGETEATDIVFFEAIGEAVQAISAGFEG